MSNENSNDLEEKLVFINRVSKIVKGGRTLSFSALVIVGDKAGRIGYGHGKAKEVPDAIKKAAQKARSSIIRVPLRDGKTLHHDSEGFSGAGHVFLKKAKEGRGIIAGGALRTVFDLLGIKDIVAKSIGSSNPFNIVRACFNGLSQQTSPKMIAQRRQMNVSDVVKVRV